MNRSKALTQLEKNLRQHASQALPETGREALCRARDVYLLAVGSFLGISFGATLAERLRQQGHRVVVVDDMLLARGPQAYGCQVISCEEFSSQPRGAQALAVNLSNAPFAHHFFTRTAAAAGVECMDVIPLLHALDIPVIYQTAQVMRDATLARLDDYLELARRLDDVLSIQTLDACLTLRLTLDRKAVLPILCSLEDEYFSPLPPSKDVSFALGDQEVLCDIGAHVGTTIYKFLTATNWKYGGIRAFEPDVENFAALNKGIFASLPNFTASNLALSDKPSTMRFAQTGTMGSHLDDSGNVSVQASTLDAEVDYATFIKMDVEGHETKVLEGGRQLISRFRPRMAVTGYHYGDDLLNIATLLQDMVPEYRLRLRHHSFYYFDTIVYADVC